MPTLTTQAKKKVALFPDFPRHSPAVKKDGTLSDTWHLQLSSLFQALQKNYKNEGLQIPQLDSANIATIQQIYAPYIGKALPQNLEDISGQEIFDTDTRERKVFIITYAMGVITAASWKTYPLT